MDRRKMLKMTGTALLGTALFGPTVLAGESNDTAKKESKKSARPKALIIGAHPDDPETCCGGTMIQLRKAGYDVVLFGHTHYATDVVKDGIRFFNPGSLGFGKSFGVIEVKDGQVLSNIAHLK